MPRLPPWLFRRAGKISPHLATLLPTCRTVESARSELRWIRHHVLQHPLQRQFTPGEGGGTRACGSAIHGRRGKKKKKNSRRSRSKARTPLKPEPSDAEYRIARLVARRGAGEPLQYVLGSQPFGTLDILCRKGVLIPRPETEAWATVLARLMSSSGLLARKCSEGEEEGLRILDLCSGTGCIGLSLYASGLDCLKSQRRSKGYGLRPPRVFGFDVSARAVRLAQKNILHNARLKNLLYDHDHNSSEEIIKKYITFQKADIFTDDWMASLHPTAPAPSPSSPSADKDTSASNGGENTPPRPDRDAEGLRGRIDILVSNPPYISQRGFAADTERSVRNHEPKLALVPPASPAAAAAVPLGAARAPEDVFYARLLDVARALRPRVAAFEVGGMAQARRVVQMAIARCRAQDLDTINEGGAGEVGKGRRARWEVVEIWRDWPDCQPAEDEAGVVAVCGKKVPVRGSGHGRVVFLAERPVYALNDLPSRA
ncbi:hypothetical protein F5Y19DRAFT_464188 [Xylariaceae sp. FL1651]|nr:hypothetical protein F5Y19DRAFT_464188 [Xylariaceae sp. FL1651]